MDAAIRMTTVSPCDQFTLDGVAVMNPVTGKAAPYYQQFVVTHVLPDGVEYWPRRVDLQLPWPMPLERLRPARFGPIA